MDTARSAREFCLSHIKDTESTDPAKKANSEYVSFIDNANFVTIAPALSDAQVADGLGCSGFTTGSPKDANISFFNTTGTTYLESVKCCKAGEDPAAVNQTNEFNSILDTLNSVQGYTELFMVPPSVTTPDVSVTMCERLREHVDLALRETLSDIRFEMTMPNCTAERRDEAKKKQAFPMGKPSTTLPALD